MSRSSLPPLEDEFTRALLGSAESDGPSPEAYAKVASALGVGIGVGVGASLPAAAVLGAAGAAGAVRWSGSLTAKVAFGLSGVLLVGAGTLLLRGEPKPAPSGAVAHAPAAARAAGAVASALPARASEPSRASVAAHAPAALSTAANLGGAASAAAAARSTATRSVGPGTASSMPRSFASALPARRTAHGAAAPLPAAAPARPSSDSSLAAQVQSLDRARVALAGGDSSAVLGEIARYRATWPNGVFLTEASVLEIEALAARGERSRAREAAAEFVAAHPDSPQADRLRALIPKKKR